MTNSQRIPTNLRTLLILEAVGESDTPMTPTQIGHAIGLPKQTIHRLCNTMLAEGFLKHETDGKGLRPGRRARHMASGITIASHNHIARHQILHQLSKMVGETVNFVIPQDKGMFYQDRVETDWAFRIQLPIGTHVPFHCTASGKTFLASLSKANRKRLLSSLDLQRQTENTFTQLDALNEELNKIAKQGFAIDSEEFMDGMVAIAVPVKNQKGRFHASLAVHGPIQRLNVQKAISLKQQIMEASQKLNTVLFSN